MASSEDITMELRRRAGRWEARMASPKPMMMEQVRRYAVSPTRVG